MVIEYTDPYYSFQNEVLKNIDAVKVIYDDWIVNSSAGSASVLADNLRHLLRTIEWDLEDIQETLIIVEKDPQRFRLSSDDISSRRQFLHETRNIVKAVRTQLESNDTRDSRAMTLSFNITAATPSNHGTDFSKSLGSAHSLKHMSPRAASLGTRVSQPDVLVASSDPVSQQQELIRYQDERLGQLGASISTLKGMSRRIGDELEDQVVLLDDFSGEMGYTESKLDAVTKRTARLLHLSTGRRQWWAIAGLSLALLIILILFVVL